MDSKIKIGIETKSDFEDFSKSFLDCRGKDLSKKDLSNIDIKVLQTWSFDIDTNWPAQEKLPKDFSPEKLLELGKEVGLGIKELHQEGIRGKGIKVAIIDQKLDLDHLEYKERIVDYSEYGNLSEEKISYHGPAVASLLLGKKCGVAPEADLVYKALPAGRNFKLQARALNDIIEANRELALKDKIRIVSCSISYLESNIEEGLDEWREMLKKAKEEGVLVIDVKGEFIDLNIFGAGSVENKDDFDSYLPFLDFQEREKDKLFEGSREEVLKKVKDYYKEEIFKKAVPDEVLLEMIDKVLLKQKERISVPVDYRTVASSWRKKGIYEYNGRGGISWAEPYLAGIFALALQLKPKLSVDRLIALLKETAIVNKNGLKMVSPQSIIQKIKEEK